MVLSAAERQRRFRDNVKTRYGRLKLLEELYELVAKKLAIEDDIAYLFDALGKKNIDNIMEELDEASTIEPEEV